MRISYPGFFFLVVGCFLCYENLVIKSEPKTFAHWLCQKGYVPEAICVKTVIGPIQKLVEVKQKLANILQTAQ